MTLSRESLQLFAELLAQVTLSANMDPDLFEETAHKIGRARREVHAALEVSVPTPTRPHLRTAERNGSPGI